MASEGEVKWTPQQRAGIETTGKSVLVSAAAGSGKTAVLAERCAYLVCDANPKCDVDELLVVTFTKAAAAEMRLRIEAALRKRLEKSADPRLSRQLMLLDRAQISTLHGFCTTVLRQYFHVLGLDPNFRVLDEEEVTLLRREIARNLLDQRYESDQSGQFQRFVDTYANGNDEIVLRRVLGLHELLGSVVDADQWLSAARKKIAQASEAPKLVESELGKELAENIRSWLDDLRRRWIQLAQQIQSIDGLSKYGEYVNELLAAVDTWRGAFDDGSFDGLHAEVNEFKAPTLPTIRNAPPQKEPIKEQIDAIRKAMREGAMADCCRFTEQEWRDGLKQTLDAVDVLVGLVRDFGQQFASAKRELRGVDFADLERFTLRILCEESKADEPSSVARVYHKQFEHVLVDEYQDINEVQDAILRLLSRECVCGERNATMNLFCVGDVKQSIYRFRLAQPQRFLKRYERFKLGQPDGQVIDLSSNFRSRGPLLEVINALFERVMTDKAVEINYDQSQRLEPGATYPPAGAGQCAFTGAPVELHLLPEAPRGSSSSGDDEAKSESEMELDRTQREAAFVAKRIGELMSGNNGKPFCVADKAEDGSAILRPIRYKDMVILLRSMKHKSDDFAQVLRAAGIPVHTDSGTGFFESMEIQDMRSLLRVLDNQQQDIPLAAVLRSPISGLADAEDCLARIRLAYPDAQAVPFHQAVVRYAKDHDDELAAHLNAFLRDLREWRRLAHQRPLAELLWHIYDCTGYLAFCAGMEDGQQRVANLIDFHERARQFGSFQRQGLSRFMEFLDSLAEQSDLGQPSVASEADDVVRVMSVHRSKGLEFPVVFLPDLGKRHNLQDTYGSILVDREAGIGLMVTDQVRRVKYPSLAHVLVHDRIQRQTLAEELRVLYVAMTRAKEHLILVGTCDEATPQRWQEQWASHVGPFPAERILGARTMLDWIGPASAAMEGARAKHRIEIAQHTEAEVSSWSTSRPRRAALSEAQMRLALLEPLDPPPKSHADAELVQRRLTTRYPYESFTKMPAHQSVGALTKEGRFAPGGTSASHGAVVSFDVELAAPRCVLRELTPAPTDVGSATHLVLEHLDFSRPCDRADLRAQVAELVRKKLILPALAEAVNLDPIAWLVTTPLGQLLRKNAKLLRRELSIYFPQQAADSDDPMDRVMVRGKVDVLIPDTDGMVILDYKTDCVTEQTVAARAEFYGPQLNTYRDAISRILNKPVKATYLVFLATGSIIPVN